MAQQPQARRKVAILGGGMAGLAAAWSLSAPQRRDEVDVTVYQRGWRLGGKAASSRGVHGRIEEHGLHIWLGYYDNAFRLVREVYEELDRPTTDPACPIRTWREAFTPSERVGVGDGSGNDWSHWVATFGRNDDEPGADSAAGGPLSVATFVRRGLRLLIDLSASIRRRDAAPEPAGVVLSSLPTPPARPDRALPLAELAAVLRQAEIAAMAGAVEAIRMLETALPRSSGLTATVTAYLDGMREDVAARLRRQDDGRRAAEVADLVITCMQGAIRDGLLLDAAGFAAIDDLDFREWLASHGAGPDALQSPLVRGMYDLVFAYEDGDPQRPRFAAGLGLFLAGKLFFEYRGSIFWRMQAGSGDVVFAPLYQALRARGVRFSFFDRVHDLHVAPDGASIEAVSMARQARLADGRTEYDPLVRVKGLPCFPSEPRAEQLADGGTSRDLESVRADRGGEETVLLRAGEDFDNVVLATSLGMVPHVCGELLERSPRWRRMVEHVATVPTQALQLWLRREERDLGWVDPGATVSAYLAPFDTYASMSHLIAREDWRDGGRPESIAYFCSVLPAHAAADPVAAEQLVRANAVDQLTRFATHIWPRAAAPGGGFRWELLCGADGESGEERLDGQFWTANVDPSDRYVQSLPGTGDHRLRADESGFANLFLAGDWIHCGLDAGCIEAAVMAGLHAANAVVRRPLTEGISGTWYGLEDA
jgi:uncharacterized protein with NAD-binding domain and iron-sulfur cluster